MLRYPELVNVAIGLEVEHFLKSHNREIFGTLRSGVPTEELKDHLDEVVQEELDRLLGMDAHAVPHWEREEGLSQCIHRLERRSILLELEALQSRYQSDDEDLQGMSVRAEELSARLRELDSGIEQAPGPA